MKRMKIGAKLNFSFGVVIVLMAVIGIVVGTLNAIVYSNINDVNRRTGVLETFTKVEEQFYEARIQGSAVLTNPDENNIAAAKENLKKTIAALDNFKIVIEETDLLENMESYNSILSNVNEYIKAIDDISDAHDDALSTSAQLSETGSSFVVLTGDMLKSLSRDIVTIDLSDSNPQSQLTKISNQLAVVNTIYEQTIIMHSQCKALIQSYGNDAETKKMVAEFDNAYEIIINKLEESLTPSAIKSVSASKENVAAMEAALESANLYKSDFERFKTIQEKILRNGTMLKNFGQTAMSTISGTSEAINEDVTANCEKASSLALITLYAVIIIVVVAIAVAFTMSRIIQKTIVPPICFVSNTLTEIGSRGRIKFTAQEWDELKIHADGNDEAAQCARQLKVMGQRLFWVSEALEAIAHGDLAVSLKSLSEDDVIGNALNHMLDSLNKLFGDVNIATHEVSGGASQISNAAEALSHGATEQASSVEELAATISNISDQVNFSAENAKNASLTVADVGNVIENSNKKMKELVVAMTDITNASNEISKIIQAIEDIAFQTNILALNASVEAARAGAAGKGFAVVANEVGALASKSAEASQSTGVLIENSVRAVEKGTKIVDETAKTLLEAVNGAKAAVAKVEAISKASGEQADSLIQVAQGVDQISNVVQTNSATAEECAASAEQLNSQANILSDNVSKFKLKQ